MYIYGKRTVGQKSKKTGAIKMGAGDNPTRFEVDEVEYLGTSAAEYTRLLTCRSLQTTKYRPNGINRHLFEVHHTA